jgi:hypothetical protein
MDVVNQAFDEALTKLSSLRTRTSITELALDDRMK